VSDDYTLTIHRGKWSLTFRDRGKPRRLTTGTADRGRAEAVARELWARLSAPASERVADLWPSYVADRKRDGVGTERFRTHELALKTHFWHRLGKAISREDCRAYHQARRELGYSASTIRTDLALLRACLRWRYGDEAPALWLPPASAPRDRWLTKAEARKLVDEAKSPHIKLFLILGLATGARSNAILDLTWDRVDFAHGTIDYRPPGRVQTNKRRTVVPMNATARAALEEAKGGALTDHVIEFGGRPVQSVKKAIERLAKATGISVSPHVLRHTCAVWMAQADVPMQKISQYLGHTSLAMTASTYARYSPSFMVDAGAAAEF
jgi:integrase